MRTLILALFLIIITTSCFSTENNEQNLNAVINNDISFKAIHFEVNENNSLLRRFDFCNDHIYVSDYRHRSLQRYSLSGELQLTHIPQTGRGPGDFDSPPYIIHCLNSGNILVAESRGRVHSFSKELDWMETNFIETRARFTDFLFETDSTYVFSLQTNIDRFNEHYVIVDKTNFEVINTINYGEIYDLKYISLKNSVSDGNYVVAAYGITGQIRVFDAETWDSHTFMSQNQKSIADISKGISKTFDINFTDRDTEVFTRDRVIQSHTIYKNKILIIANLFSDYPKEFIEVYDFEGNMLKKYPLSFDIDMIFTKNSNLYGISNFGENDFTIYQIFLD